MSVEITTTPEAADSAIAQACAEMSLPRESVHVETLSGGQAGEPLRLRLSAIPADDESLRIARETMEELLGKMRVRAEVSAAWDDSEAEEDSGPALRIDIHGEDLSLLIGRKGETLAALQFLTRLMVSRQLGDGVNLIVDVAGHRQRRKEQLQRLALRMADQAVQRQRTCSLEPMPANERRIVHLTLRNHPDVRTESVGEGDRRKVTIIPRSA